MTLGFEQAGFDIRASVEFDPVHAAVHHFNFPAGVTLPVSVATLTAGDIRRAAGLGDAEVDVVFGGPPCQGFSLIGHRLLEDPRNSLVHHFVRLVGDLKARYFVFENVKGLTQGKQLRLLNELVEAFQSRGYQVRPWRVLNASHYDVPQDRQRLFLLGARRDLELPHYPLRRTSPHPIEGQIRLGSTLSPPPTCRCALSDLPEAEDFPQLLRSDAVETASASWGVPSDYAQLLRCESEAAWHFGYRRTLSPQWLTSSLRTGHTAISRQRFSETAPGATEPISRFYKLPPDGLSNTLRSGTDSSRGAFTSPRPIHYERARCITVREMARLHGYPDWFRFHRTKWHGARQIGNSVPPPLARAVAAEVIRAMGLNPMSPDQEFSLGDEQILQMSMRAAAAYWGIEVPIRNRDRKSGAKKRKQEDIEPLRLAGARG